MGWRASRQIQGRPATAPNLHPPSPPTQQRHTRYPPQKTAHLAAGKVHRIWDEAQVKRAGRPLKLHAVALCVNLRRRRGARALDDLAVCCGLLSHLSAGAAGSTLACTLITLSPPNTGGLHASQAPAAECNPESASPRSTSAAWSARTCAAAPCRCRRPRPRCRCRWRRRRRPRRRPWRALPRCPAGQAGGEGVGA